MIVMLLLFMLCLIALEAFFSGSEMALISCNRIKIRHQAVAGAKGAQVAERLLERPDRLLATTLVGTNLCVVTNAAVAALLCIFLLGQGREYYATVFLTPLLLLFGEMVPKAYFRHHADRLTPLLAPPLYVCLRLFAPLTAIVHRASTLLLIPLRLPATARDPYISREELKLLVQEGNRQANLDTEERRMIHKIIHFSETTAKEAMTPLIEVVAVPAGASAADAAAVVSEHDVSRIPVYEERIDNIVGIVHAFDLLTADLASPLAPLIRPTYFVPETKPIDALLQEMQRGRVGMAVVVDEYGGVVGIVAIEDLLEEIVGEIEDEYEEEPPPVRRLPDGSYLVDARLEADRFGEELGIRLPEGEFETLGGFLLSLFQKIPDAGEEVHYAGIRFVVAESDKRSIVKVRVRLPKQPAERGQRI